MADGLFPGREMPAFNILGLLLGGRGYAADYFGNKDKLAMLDAEDQRSGKFADAWVKSPQVKASVANPYDRQAQLDMWAASQYGPEGARNVGSSYLDKMISATNDRSNISYSDELSRERITLSADEQIRVELAKAKLAEKDRQRMMDEILGPSEVPGMSKQAVQLRRNMSYKQAMGEMPADRDVVMTDDGLAFAPKMGGETWIEMSKGINSIDNITGMLTDLEQMAKEGTGTKGAWETTRGLLLMEYKKAMELGALDKDSKAYLDELIPNKWDNLSVSNPLAADIVGAKIRVLKNRNDVSRKQWNDRYVVPADKVINRSMITGDSTSPGGVIRPPSQAEITAAKAREANLKTEAEADQKKRKIDQRGNRSRTGLWDEGDR